MFEKERDRIYDVAVEPRTSTPFKGPMVISSHQKEKEIICIDSDEDSDSRQKEKEVICIDSD